MSRRSFSLSLTSLAPLALLAAVACGPALEEPVAPVPSASAAAAIPPSPATAAPAAPTASGEAPKPYAGHGAGSVSAELLAKYAPPALPPASSARIQAMLDVRSPGAGLLSEDGKHLFFSWTVTGLRQVFRLDGPNTFPKQLTGGEDATSVVAATLDGKTLILSRDRRGEEYPGLYLQPAAGGPLTVIQHLPKVQTVFDRLSEDGASIFFHANDEKPDAYAIYRYDLASKTKQRVFGETGLWAVADQKGDKLLLAKMVGSNMTEYYELDLTKKATTPLFGVGEREDYVAKYGAKEGEILVQTPHLGEYRRLYSWTAGKLTPLSPELPNDVADFAIDGKRTRILYTVNEGGYTRLRGLDAKTGKPIDVPKFEGADHVRVASFSKNGRFTTFSVETATSPGRGYVYDWQAKKLTPWHEPSSPEIDTSRFAKATLESYVARDGTKIPMFVRRPERCEGPCPVVMMFHGGPEAQALPGFNARVQLFVDAGFIVAEPNVRGSDGYGKTWLHADDGAKRLAVITDIEDAAKHARTAFAKDGKAPRVAIFGGSYGGYSALMGMTMFAGAYDVGVSVVGISNLVTFLENTAPYRRALRISEYGDPDKDRDALVKLSPTTYADKANAPLFILQGATDPRVPAGEAIQIFDTLKQRNVPSDLIIFADEGHGVQKRENQVLLFGHVLRFLDQHLRGPKG
jgi:dipeptidyl aminopeptidase/acylaminoacyl peptidase